MPLSDVSSYPIEQIRAQFPALKREHRGKTVAYFDGPGGTQVVSSAIEAMTNYMRNGGANLHGYFPTSHETENIIQEAREAIADLLEAKPYEIAFGANTTSLTFAISRSLARNWTTGDEIVVSELDHRAGVDPWITAAQDKGVTVRWLPVDSATMTLDLSELDTIINEKTVLVSVAVASNIVGTITDVSKIARRAKAVGALVAVDAVHAVPHLVMDRDQLNADILLCSVYKFFGPHIGVATIREALFTGMEAYKLLPAPIEIPDKLETGTQNHEGLASVKPVIDFIASLGKGATRREKIINAFDRIEAYENKLANKIRERLASMPKITLYQASEEVQKTPTIAFRVDGMTPRQVSEFVVDHAAVFIADGDFYATTLASKLNLHESGGWARAGLAPYNTEEEVDRFLEAIQTLTNQ